MAPKAHDAIASRDAAWNQFRGPNGTGIAAAGRFSGAIGPDTNVIWKRDFPQGHSSPVLSPDRIFLTGVEQERLFTYAVDRATGETLWKREVPRPRRTKFHGDNHAAAASAAVDGDHVAVFFDEFGLLLYDLDGEERWRVPLGPFDNVYGMAASPILVDDRVVLACDQSTGSYVAAYAVEDGRELWKAMRPKAVSGHCTPVVHRDAAGRTQVILPGSLLLDAYDAATGERIWWVRGLPAEMKSVPVVLGERLWIHGFASPLNNRGNQVLLDGFEETVAARDADEDGRISKAELPDPRLERHYVFFDLDGDGSLDEAEWISTREQMAATNAAMLVQLGGDGDVTDSHVVWRFYRSIPQLPSPLVFGGTYYMLADQGGLITTLDPDSGELIGKGRLLDAVDAYYASPVGGDGKVYLLSQSGLLTVLSVDRGLEPIHSAAFDEPCYATPALEDGRIYLRTARSLYCF